MKYVNYKCENKKETIFIEEYLNKKGYHFFLQTVSARDADPSRYPIYVFSEEFDDGTHKLLYWANMPCLTADLKIFNVKNIIRQQKLNKII